MRILGIDYGKRKIGISFASTSLAEPYRVVRFKTGKEGIEKVRRVARKKRAKQVVVGISEGKLGEESRKFGIKLEKSLGIPVFFQDETLTTHEAQELSRKAGIKREKRRALEDAYSAALILQSYLDLKN